MHWFVSAGQTALLTADTDEKFSLANTAEAVMIHGDMSGTNATLDVYHIVGTGTNGETLTQIGSLVGVDATAFVAGLRSS